MTKKLISLTACILTLALSQMANATVVVIQEGGLKHRLSCTNPLSTAHSIHCTSIVENISEYYQSYSQGYFFGQEDIIDIDLNYFHTSYLGCYVFSASTILCSRNTSPIQHLAPGESYKVDFTMHFNSQIGAGRKVWASYSFWQTNSLTIEALFIPSIIQPNPCNPLSKSLPVTDPDCGCEVPEGGQVPPPECPQ